MSMPWLAALLNILPLPLGFGYLIIGRWKRFGIGFLMGLAAVVALPAIFIGVLALGSWLMGWQWICIGGCNKPGPDWYAVLSLALGFVPILILASWTAHDAWRLARVRDAVRLGRAT